MNIVTHSHMIDADLLQQIASGNKAVFNELYERYWEVAYAEAYKRLKDPEQAKDIVQEIFTHIWLKKDILHFQNFAGYLYIAIRNQVFKIVAKQKKMHPFFDILESMPVTYPQADGNLLWKEFFAAYEAILNTLPSKRKIIFRLRFQDDFTTTEIAHQLGLSRKTINNQLGKAIEQLRVSLLQLLTALLIIIVHH